MDSTAELKDFFLNIHRIIPAEHTRNLITDNLLKGFDFEAEEIEQIKQAHFNVKENCIIFNFGMAGGKTHNSIEFIKNTVKDRSVIWITPRISLAKNTLGRIDKKDLKAVDYLNAGKNNEKLTTFNDEHGYIKIIQGESLHKMKDIKNIDVVIIDEIETFLKSFGQDRTHGKNHEINFNVLVYMLKNAKKIILLDAFISNITLNFIKNLNITYKIYKNKKPPNKMYWREFARSDDFLNKIVNKLKKGKKIFLYYPYKNSTMFGPSMIELAYYFYIKSGGNKVILFYNGDTPKEPKKPADSLRSEPQNEQRTAYKSDLLTCEKWTGADVVICNSSITVGVSYDELNIFDSVFLWYKETLTDIRDLIQVSKRIRNPINKTLYLYRDEKPLYNHLKFLKTIPKLKEKNSLYFKLWSDIIAEKLVINRRFLVKLSQLANYEIKNLEL